MDIFLLDPDYLNAGVCGQLRQKIIVPDAIVAEGMVITDDDDFGVELADKDIVVKINGAHSGHPFGKIQKNDVGYAEVVNGVYFFLGGRDNFDRRAGLEDFAGMRGKGDDHRISGFLFRYLKKRG